MGISKTPSFIARFAACLAFLLIVGTVSAADTWVTYTSLSDIQQIKVLRDTVYVATSGGLLAIGDPAGPGKIYNNLNGLGTVDIHAMLEDADGRFWVAGYGRLVRFDSHGAKQFLFMDNDGKLLHLYSLADDGDNLWVGSEVGLILFSKSKDGGQIQDSYDLFGNLNPAPTVYDVELTNDSIWLATSAGIAVANRSNPVLLNAPDNWATFGPLQHPELGTSKDITIAAFGSDLYVATSVGAYRLDRTATDTAFVSIPSGPYPLASDVVVENDTLWIYYRFGLASYANGVAQHVALPAMPSIVKTGAHRDGELWIALRAGGLYRITAGNTAVSYPYVGAPANLVNDIAAHNGVLTVGFGRSMIAQFNGETWKTLTTTVGDGVTVAAIDSTGAAWVGAIGQGAWRIIDDSVKNYDETNSTLRGNNDGSLGVTYVFVKGIASDNAYIFMACYRALNGYPVAIGRLDRLDDRSAWDSLGIQDGITDTFATALDYQRGQLVMGTEAGGLFWCNLGPDPTNKSDDSCRHFTKQNSFLRSDAVRVVKFAPDGTLWVGTNFGLSRWDWGIERFVDVNLPAGVGPDITDIAIDTRGNVWASANNGLARLDAAAGTFTTYHALTSGLLSDDVRSLTLDPVTGDLYVGTASGISVLRSPIARPTQELDSVIAFPNPFVISSGTERLNFNFARPYTVRIFDVSGALVRENIVTGSWDGRNQKGERVASGVYIFVLEDTDGNVARGKILLVTK